MQAVRGALAVRGAALETWLIEQEFCASSDEARAAALLPPARVGRGYGDDVVAAAAGMLS